MQDVVGIFEENTDRRNAQRYRRRDYQSDRDRNTFQGKGVNYDLVNQRARRER